MPRLICTYDERTIHPALCPEKRKSHTLLCNFNTPLEAIAGSVVAIGSKGTTTDGMHADNKGNVFYTMPEGKGIGFYSPADNGFRRFLSDDRMLSVDGVVFDQKGSILFNNNRLHQMFDEDGSDIDWNNPYYLIIWKAYVGTDVKSYLYARCRRTRTCSPQAGQSPMYNKTPPRIRPDGVLRLFG